MRELNEKNTVAFWKKYKGEFMGDFCSRLIVKWSRKYMGRKVLDIGAGSGALIDLIPGSIGIDLVPRNERIIRADISEIPFDDGEFDTVFATEILEHLDSGKLQKGLGEIYRVLKSGGYIIITTPFNENLDNEMVICPKCRERFHRWGHHQVFDAENIRNILEGKGFRVVHYSVSPIQLIAKYPFLTFLELFLKNILNKQDYAKYLSLFCVAMKK